MDKGTNGDFVSDCHVTIADELTSSTGETGLKPDSEDTGHERLLRKTASTEGKSIPHCRASRPPHYLCFAIIVTLCCNFPFGGVAVIFSLMSRKSGRNGNVRDAELWGNVSKWLSIVGIAVAAVIVAFLVVYYVCIDKNIVDTTEELEMNVG